MFNKNRTKHFHFTELLWGWDNVFKDVASQVLVWFSFHFACWLTVSFFNPLTFRSPCWSWLLLALSNQLQSSLSNSALNHVSNLETGRGGSLYTMEIGNHKFKHFVFYLTSHWLDIPGTLLDLTLLFHSGLHCFHWNLSILFMQQLLILSLLYIRARHRVSG